MTTITIYRNKRNKNKYIEVHNDGYYHNSVKQYMQWKKANLMELLEDYELITAQEDGRNYERLQNDY